MISRTLAALPLVVLAACADFTRLPPGADTGRDPRLAEPAPTRIPTVNIAPAGQWARGETPRPAPGLAVNAFATGLDHPRNLYVLPNGDVLVAETNKPHSEPRGFRARAMAIVMKAAGAGVTSANRITLLRDTDGDGVAETRSVFLSGLNSPFGMALVGNDFYVANTDAIVRFRYTPGATTLAEAGTRVTDLPAGERNGHWTRSLVASRDGAKLYVSVGSDSNIAEHGLATEEGRAAIWEVDRASGAKRLFATGLRNANGLAIDPMQGRLWAVVNERDELGSDLVPDYLTSVAEGAFYGWPWSYWGANVDTRVQPARPEMVQRAVRPDYALGSHVAPLGLAFTRGAALPAQFADGAIVSRHGSWNRVPLSGYDVVFVPFVAGRADGALRPVLGGFVDDQGRARGRPVGVAFDARGALLVADDVGNVVWRVTQQR